MGASSGSCDLIARGLWETCSRLAWSNAITALSLIVNPLNFRMTSTHMEALILLKSQ